MGSTTHSGSTVLDADSTSSTTAPSATTEEEYEPIFDVGEIPPGPEMDGLGCSKVDFLFVIDNSGSMDDDQMNLIAAFPDFIQGIQDTLVGVDGYHVGIITTDGYAPNDCPVMGGLVTQTGGMGSSNMDCKPYASGLGFMTQEDNLADKFACAAQVGVEGNGTERPMEALGYAVSPLWAGEGDCNEGFMRNDALLVVTIITDEADGPETDDCPRDPEGHSIGNPDSWFVDVVAAKGGIPANAAVITLHYLPGECDPPDELSDGCNILAFTDMFGVNGFKGCINGDYGQIFTEATETISTACANFIPPG